MKDFSKTRELLVSYVEQLEEEKVLALANQALEEGMPPLLLLELMTEGMDRVGRLYVSKDYYIADLIMAGLIFRQVLELSKFASHFRNNFDKKSGKVIIGTVKDDIHDIGKEIFRGIMEAHGFEVIDLGVDVAAETFIKRAEECQPDIIGMSGVLTSTLDQMKQVVDAFVQAGLRDKVRIIAGANYLTLEACKYIGADGFATEALDGANICMGWMNLAHGNGVQVDD